jgi:RIO kinase 1
MPVFFNFQKVNMKPTDVEKMMEELDEDRERSGWIIKGERRPPPPRRVHKGPPQGDAAFIHFQDDSVRTFGFTYKAARFEEGWLLDSLGSLYEQHWIADVLRKLKGGKEASVYLCRSGVRIEAPLVAAKVYRPRMLRNLKNDQLYRQGREVLDDEGNPIRDLGMLKAQHKRSVYGEQIRHQSWIAHEFQALQSLHAAGTDVPRPYEMGLNAILMEYIGDDLSAAPTLNTVTLGRGEAGPLYRRLLQDIDLMLAHEIVHADLSAYNVLYQDGEPTLIDFPQVVSPRRHPCAWRIFARDMARLCEYFTSQGLALQPHRQAAELWRAHGYRLIPEVDPRLLDGSDPRPGASQPKKDSAMQDHAG